MTKRTHGLSRTHPLYGTWGNMMTRCYNPNFKQFADYGGRGISVCDRWHNPQLFIEDIERLIGPRPVGMTLDRIDNNGNYEPGKVRWATRVQQNRNSRRYVDGQRQGGLYPTWWRIMRRCPEELYEDWRVFADFTYGVIRELGGRPTGLRFDRIDDSRSYEPGNVAWVTGAQQVQRAIRAKAADPVPRVSAHPLYGTWTAMMTRCYNPVSKDFKSAGALGVIVCDAWHDSRNFVRDIDRLLGQRPEGRTFRRTDSAGNYEPGNVEWGARGRPPRR